MCEGGGGEGGGQLVVWPSDSSVEVSHDKKGKHAYLDQFSCHIVLLLTSFATSAQPIAIVEGKSN